MCNWLHRLKRSWHSCPREVNAGNKNTPSMHHALRGNVTTSVVELKTVTSAKISPKMVNPKDIECRRKWPVRVLKKEVDREAQYYREDQYLAVRYMSRASIIFPDDYKSYKKEISTVIQNVMQTHTPTPSHTLNPNKHTHSRQHKHIE